MASASICCWPPESVDASSRRRSDERREQVEGALEPTLKVGVVVAVHERRHLEVLVDGHRGEHTLAAEQDADARGGPAAPAWCR